MAQRCSEHTQSRRGIDLLAALHRALEHLHALDLLGDLQDPVNDKSISPRAEGDSSKFWQLLVT